MELLEHKSRTFVCLYCGTIAKIVTNPVGVVYGTKCHANCCAGKPMLNSMYKIPEHAHISKLGFIKIAPVSYNLFSRHSKQIHHMKVLYSGQRCFKFTVYCKNHGASDSVEFEKRTYYIHEKNWPSALVELHYLVNVDRSKGLESETFNGLTVRE